MSRPVPVAVVFPDRRVREALCSIVRRHAALRLAGQGADAASALGGIDDAPEPPLVLLDADLPGGESLRVLAGVRTACPRAWVLGLTGYDAEYARHWREAAGGAACADLAHAAEALTAACRAMAAGRRAFDRFRDMSPAPGRLRRRPQRSL